MPLTLSCRDLGSSCDVTVSGETLDEILDAMCDHAIEAHGRTKEEIYSEENRTVFRSAVKQSSRPARTRTSKLDV